MCLLCPCLCLCPLLLAHVCVHVAVYRAQLKLFLSVSLRVSASWEAFEACEAQSAMLRRAGVQAYAAVSTDAALARGS